MSPLSLPGKRCRGLRIDVLHSLRGMVNKRASVS